MATYKAKVNNWQETSQSEQEHTITKKVKAAWIQNGEQVTTKVNEVYIYHITNQQDATCYRCSGVAEHEGCSPQELILRVLEWVARRECYCSDDFLLRVVVWEGLVTRSDKDVGWNVKQSPSHMELPVCSHISLQGMSVGKKWSWHKKLLWMNSASSLVQSTNFLSPLFCNVNKSMTVLQPQHKTPIIYV